MDIILLHGALGSKTHFEELQQLLTEKTEVHTLNFSGHGGEAFEDNFNIHQFSIELKSYIDTFPRKQFCVFGYSMGGYVALYLERHFPGTVASIYTLATKFDWNVESSAQEAAMLNADKILEKVPPFAKQLENRHGSEKWKVLLERTAKMMLEMGINPPLSFNDFSEIKVPVVITRGDLDKMVSKEESVNVANALPNGFFRSYSNWQHPFEKIDVNILATDLIAFCSPNKL
jgi:esterase/lipase